jgi:dihydrofolate reductase
MNKETKFLVFIAMSLDGFIAGENGELDWLSIVTRSNEDYGYQKFIDAVDLVLLGKKTYEVMKGFPEWPMNDKDCIVFSQSPMVPLKNETFFSGTAEEFIQQNISKPYQNVYVDGGHLIHSFLKVGLIYSLTISIIPILLGRGIPLFKGGLEKSSLQLVETKTFDSGLVQVTYKIPR